MALIRRKDITAAWYTDAGDPSSIVKEAYDEALAHFERDLAGDSQAIAWVRGTHVIDDVLDLAEKAKSQYSSGLGFRKEAHRWSLALSQRVLYYGQIFDTLSQHHPEYVSLAWGAIKFVLQGVINHAELVSEFAKAISEIADVLPRIELRSKLYPTTVMKDFTVRVYAQVMLFLRQAVKWYTMGSFKRTCSSIIKPWSLSYKETCNQIRTLSISMESTAHTASQAELRDLTITFQEHDTKLENLKALIEQVLTTVNQQERQIIQVLQYSRDTNDLSQTFALKLDDQSARLRDIQFTKVLDLLRPKRSPEDILHTCRSIAKRRQTQQTTSPIETEHFIRQLKQWTSAPGPTLFALHAGLRAEGKAKDLASEVVTLLQANGCRVVWFFSERFTADEHADFPSLLKTLVFQLLSQDVSVVQDQPGWLCASQFAQERSQLEWEDLIVALLSRGSGTFLIVESEALCQRSGQGRQWSERLLATFDNIITKVANNGYVLKVLIVSYGLSGSMPASINAQCISTTVRAGALQNLKTRRLLLARKAHFTRRMKAATSLNL